MKKSKQNYKIPRTQRKIHVRLRPTDYLKIVDDAKKKTRKSRIEISEMTNTKII